MIRSLRARRTARPALAAGVFVAALAFAALAGAIPASAHALAVSSTPPAGSTLAEAPKAVTIVFSETPDPRLSTIQILDSAGGTHQVGRSAPVAGEPTALEVAVGPLDPGVYTVSWRTVSRVDGHLASGSFAFGVKVTPGVATTSVVRSPPASTWAVAARWSFYIGAMGLLGVGVVGLIAGSLRRLRVFAAGAWVVAIGGVVALEEQQRRSDGVAFSSLFSSSLGHQVLWRAIPLLVAAAGVAPLLVRPSRRLPVVAIGGSALAAMFGDVESSHVSGERSWRWFHVLTQWVHFGSAGIWLGGLAVLLGVLGTLKPESRQAVIARFSNLALISVLFVAGTGLLRGLDEIRTWHGLFDTSFGKWAIVKIALLAALIGLGYLQRRRGVPLAGRGGTRFLRRTGSVELALAAVVLVAAGFLQSLAPPSATASPAAPKPLVVTGSDFATTVKARLQISPGTPGFNKFDLRALDYDTSRPVPTQSVTLTFDLPSRPDLGSSTLSLIRQRNGDYVAVAPNLSVGGTWTINVLVQNGTQSAEIPFTVTTRSVPLKIDASRSPGLPTVYTIHVTPTASIQVYLDPGRPGFNEFHVTLLSAGDNEIPTSHVAVHAARSSSIAAPLTVRPLDNIGHYVADLSGAISGRYTFSIDATTDQGSLHADITISIP